ncbi:MAG: response regulator [Candidatus Thorarchaeota archaeon]
MTKKGKILVMDDDNSFCEVLKAILESLGHQGIFVHEGERMVSEYKKAKMTKEPFDLVIADFLIKKGLSGEEGIKLLLKYDPAAKIILSSGYSNLPIIRNYKEFGITDVLLKPYNMKVLDAMIQKWI